MSKTYSKMYSGLHIKYLSFLSDFNESCKFLDRFSKNAEISNFMKIRAVGAQLLHAGGRAGRLSDRQTDMTKIIIALSSFANAPRNLTDGIQTNVFFLW